MLSKLTFVFVLSMMALMAGANAQVLDCGPLERPTITAEDEETSGPQVPLPDNDEVVISTEATDNGIYIVVTYKPSKRSKYIFWAPMDGLGVDAVAYDFMSYTRRLVGLDFAGGGRLKLQRQTNGLLSFKLSTSLPEPDKASYAYARADLSAKIPLKGGWQVARRSASYEDKISAGWNFSKKWKVGLLVDLSGKEADRGLSLEFGGIGLDASYTTRSGKSISFGWTVGEEPKFGLDLAPIVF